MDNISKRSKEYAFIECQTEEAGGATLKARNGEVAHKCWFADSLYMTSNYLLFLRIYFYMQAIKSNTEQRDGRFLPFSSHSPAFFFPYQFEQLFHIVAWISF
jgi:hypothetical protein